MKKKRTGRGGARPGSGRKKKPGRQLNTYIAPELWTSLDAHCRETGSSKRDAVETALRDYLRE